MRGQAPFHSASIPAGDRVGPHNQDVISVLVGNLLGDGHGEKRRGSTRFQVHTSSRNAEYAFWLHRFFAVRGYCSPRKPVARRQIGKGDAIYFSIRFHTFSFKSLNSLYDDFYAYQPGPAHKGGWKKRVPPGIEGLLTPMALAIWVMDGGGRSGSGLKISTEGFSLSDCLLLQGALDRRFSLKPTVERHGKAFLLYFKKSDLEKLHALIKTHLLPCMAYKLSTGTKTIVV